VIWLSDQGRFRIVKYDPNGRRVGGFEGDTANGDKFDYPSRIALAPDGWLYVVQSTYDNVKVYDEKGTLRQTLPIPSPMSVAVNDEMAIIGAQSGFAAYDRDGQVIGIVGTRGIEDDQFDTVNGVAIDEDSNAYIVDTFNNRISKYDREGERVWMVETGRPGNRAGSNMDPGDANVLAEKYPAMMQAPMGATMDAAGRLVVIDLLDFSIVAFDPEDGSVLGKWGTFGREDGKFMYPADIDYDAAMDYYVVSDSGNQRAQIIRLPGSGGGAMATARRLLAGPLRACLIPLLLLLLALIVTAFIRNRRKRRELQVIDAEPLTEGAGEA
jgi:DNA-binding beta-propeller fold protein YncE